MQVIFNTDFSNFTVKLLLALMLCCKNIFSSSPTDASNAVYKILFCNRFGFCANWVGLKSDEDVFLQTNHL